MMTIQEPFAAAEIKYRQLRAVQQYDQKPSRADRRQHWVPRRAWLHLPHRPRGTTAVV